MAVDLMLLSEFGESATSMLGQVYGVIKRESVGALERAAGWCASAGRPLFSSLVLPASTPVGRAKARGHTLTCNA